MSSEGPPGGNINLPWCASHSPSSTRLGFAARVIKLPRTINDEYSSRKKNGGLRELEGACAPSEVGWLSKDMAEDNAGEWGMGGKLGPWPGAADGE